MTEDLTLKYSRLLMLTKRELAILYTMNQVRDTSKSSNDYYKSLVAKLLRIFNTQLAFAVAYYKKTESCEVKATNAKGILKQDDYEVIKRLSKDCIERSVPLTSNNVRRGTVLHKLKIKNFIAVPIGSATDSLGVLLIMNKLKGDYNKSDLRFMAMIANQAFYGLQNMKLYDDLEQKADRESELTTLLYHKEKTKAVTDELTGVYNKRHFLELLESEITIAHNNSKPLSMIMFDIDHFGSFNNTFGHAEGDKVIKDVAKATKKLVAEEGFVCRYGGEEFIAVLPGIDVDIAAKLAEKIRRAVEDLYDPKRGDLRKITVSIGVAQLKEEETQEKFIKRVDKFLYISKEKGRNAVNVSR